MGRISIIVPMFNAMRTLDRAFQSILAQTFTDWEVIFVNDASTDGSAEWVNANYCSDSRVTLLQQPQNHGPSAARNRAIDAAKGEWIALLDADDAWGPDRLESLLAESEDADFIADNIVTYDAIAEMETGQFLDDFELPILTLEDALIGWLGNRKMDAGYLKPMMRTEFLRRTNLKYQLSLRHGEDFTLYCEALAQGARFRLVNSCGYIYTTSVGRRSKQHSPHSWTRPDPIALSEALSQIREKHRQSLSDTESSALARYSANLIKSAPRWEFECALDQRRYFECSRLFVRHDTVRRKVAKSILVALGLVRDSRPIR
jgi:succinoglycan biosynthesis protein ExoO